MQNYSIFYQFRIKLVITHTNAIKWKEKHDGVVIDCHHSLRLFGNRMKMSLPKKNVFLGRLPLLPGSHLGQNFGPLGDYFALVTP